MQQNWSKLNEAADIIFAAAAGNPVDLEEIRNALVEVGIFIVEMTMLTQTLAPILPNLIKN